MALDTCGKILPLPLQLLLKSLTHGFLQVAMPCVNSRPPLLPKGHPWLPEPQSPGRDCGLRRVWTGIFRKSYNLLDGPLSVLSHQGLLQRTADSGKGGSGFETQLSPLSLRRGFPNRGRQILELGETDWKE